MNPTLMQGVSVGAGLLAGWASETGGRGARGLLRVAFYGRVSTEDRQDAAVSCAWQVDRAEATIAGEGVIVERFFDHSQSRQVAFGLRPEGASLIAALKDPNRGFDAVVIGSFERTFYGNQFSLVAPLLEKYGVSLWMPEVGGRVTEGHDGLMALLGILARREIIRARARTVGDAIQQRGAATRLSSHRGADAGYFHTSKARGARAGGAGCDRGLGVTLPAECTAL